MKRKYLAAAALPAVLALNAAAQPGLGELLSYDLADLANVQVVSVSKELQPVSKAPGTVRVITAEQIKEHGYQTLEEALAGLPGFQFRDISGFNSYVFLRGVPNQNNLILLLVDGVQINELNSGGFYGGAQYNLANVERIEVVYGPASALYGTNAMSGVINIITRDPRDLQGAEGSALAGSFDTRAMDFSYGHHEGDRGLSLSGKLYSTAKSNLRGSKGDNNWSDSMENFEADQSFDGKYVYKGLTFGAIMQDKRSSKATNEKTTGSDLVDFGTDWHIRFANAYLKYLYDEARDWSLESRLYYRSSTVMDDTVARVYSTVCSTCGQQGQYRPNDMVGLENQVRFQPADGLDLTAGLVAEHENLANTLATTYSGDPLVRPPAPANPGMVNSDLLSLYAQLKALYGEAFRAPRPWDYTYGLGNSSLNPEKLYSSELSANYSLTSHLRADLAVYRNKLTSLHSLSGNRWVNSGSIETRGAEARLEYARGSLKSYLNYTLQISEDSAGSDVAEIGRNNAGAGLLYAFSSRVKLDLGLRYLGRRKNPQTITATNSDFVGGAVVTDATLSLAGTRGLELQFLAKNLFDEKYYHTSNLTVERYRQSRRQLLLRVGYAFGAKEDPV